MPPPQPDPEDQFHSPLTRKLMGVFTFLVFAVFALVTTAGAVAWAINQWKDVLG